MRKWVILFAVAVLVFTISGCSASPVDKMSIETESTNPTIEDTEATVPRLDSIEYWEIVQEEIIAMLNKNNLYVAAINSSYPCVLYEVEPGKQTDDGKIVAAGLSQEQYEELYEYVKDELYIILDKYELAEPKSAFHACDSIVGISFNNWFVDEKKVSDRVDSLQIANYQLDLLEYYYDHEGNAYILMDGFSEDKWSKYPVYTP